MEIKRSDLEIDADYGKVKILYQDSSVIVIFKPSGLLSVPAPGGKGRSAQSVLETIMRKTGRFSSSFRPAAVHRLDRDTSGVMMFALTKSVQQKIMDNWQSVVTRRLYHAVAENPRYGRKIPLEGRIDAPLAYNAYHVAYVPRNDGRGGKHGELVNAVTNYRILKEGKKFTLFELDLETGRKNQIRAHLSSLGYPISGDTNYRAATGSFGRLALNACLLEFIHPETGRKLEFAVPEPVSWRKI